MAEQGFRKWIITITVIMASLLELIDTTIVNVALPDIMGNLGATLEEAFEVLIRGLMPKRIRTDGTWPTD